MGLKTWITRPENRKIIQTTMLVALFAAFFLWRSATSNTPNRESTPVLVGNQTVQAEVVTSDEDITKGLSGRESLEDGQGMLFVFDPPRAVFFWMKEMKFPIDMVFISDNRIVAIQPNVPPPAPGTPEKDLVLYPSQSAVNMVLEVPAGWSEKQGLKVGDEVKIGQ